MKEDVHRRTTEKTRVSVIGVKLLRFRKSNATAAAKERFRIKFLLKHIPRSAIIVKSYASQYVIIAPFEETATIVIFAVRHRGILHLPVTETRLLSRFVRAAR